MAVITLTTDFRDADGFTGVMKGVIHGIAPDLSVIDLAHGIPPGDIVHAAYVLRNAYLYFPPGTVHVVVVDPGVGGRRKAIAVRGVGQFFVAPDNGVLAWVLRELTDAGETVEAWSLEDERFHLDPVSATFHGRDIFAPVGAFLARGIDPGELGSELETDFEPEGEIEGGPVLELLRQPGERRCEGRIIHVDTFGNCITTIEAGILPEAVLDHQVPLEMVLESDSGPLTVTGLRGSYSAVPRGEAAVIEGSGGLLEIAVNGGSAAQILGLGRGTPGHCLLEGQPLSRAVGKRDEEPEDLDVRDVSGDV